ncbi:MAG: sterol desaturase family protein, partial [Candidatus Eisenbacteria bacterium]|nr:sterol desaturase family protein [Candidatus Eisenbacteria bacterium]
MALAFGVLLLIFLPLERAFPAHRQSIFRKEWGTDLLFFAGQYLLWTVPVVSILGFLYMNANALPLGWAREFVAKQPLWIQIPAIILISDLCVYWFHRWSHRNPFLWRIHRVHHTAEKLDWLAAHREHPIDNLLTRFVENLPLILLG